ncbi:hypothetical protein GUJ93_ZPchr0008g12151 [Zizania palustris]|uniref:Uncharacterized protein n=1 Tax=Zizania palustris TaxID=103762 RepID=A0A8J5R5L6_ZIZPA|nr:hypothetical protein GUJ93_ZPchr0008g12151 [Zizania palustris]
MRRQEVRTSRAGGRQRRRSRWRTTEAEPTGGGGGRRPGQAAMTADGSTPATAGGDPRLAADGGPTPRSDGMRPDSAANGLHDDGDGATRDNDLHDGPRQISRRAAKLWRRRRREGPDPAANDQIRRTTPGSSGQRLDLAHCHQI